MYRNIEDDEFIENVSADIKYFVNDVRIGACISKSVLLFPPVNNYRRFLIHKICGEETLADLNHFSIGQGHDRRTVVCFTKDLVRVPEPMMGIDQYRLPSIPPSRHVEEKKWKVMPAVDIYRPPAARRLSAQQARTPSIEPEKPKSKPRRPDIQVYVPRPKRLSAGATEPSPSPAPTSIAGRRHLATLPPESHPPNFTANPLHMDAIPPTQNVTKCSNKVDEVSGFDQSTSQSLDDSHIHLCQSERVNEELTYSNHQLSDTVSEMTEPETFDNNSCNELPPDCSSTVNLEHFNKDLCSDCFVSECKISNTEDKAIYVPNQFNNISICNDDFDSETMNGSSNFDSTDHCIKDEKVSDREIVVSYNRKQCEDVCANHEEQNRKNRLILHGKVMSDVLVISDPEPVHDLTASHVEPPPDIVLPKKKISKPKEKPIVPLVEAEQLSSVDISKLNPDDCTWDMMFDENGDCLNPILMEELTSKVGKVVIKTPRSDYKSFVTRAEFQPNDEYSHVLEIYNFSPEFKTQDLVNIFSSYKDKGFEIKWVDDTHALGVFSSSVVAADVLATDHPFVKTRPLHEATSESRVKARRSSEFLRPYRARPETCPALARRLVTGALGVRLKTAKQEREAEKALLSQAREKKRLEARQKDDAWEGTLGVQ